MNTKNDCCAGKCLYEGLSKEQEEYLDNHPESSVKHPTEIKFPKQTSDFKQIIDEMYRIHLAKNQDYSPANVLAMGELGVVVRMWDKFCRICNLMGYPVPNPKPKIEALIESYKNMKPSEATKFVMLDRDCVVANLENLVKECVFDFTQAQKKQPANEPLEDAFLDMAVYSIIGKILLNGQWGK